MTIEFKEDLIAEREKSTREPYIGYFAPNGDLINYNIAFGGNYHDAWRNPVSIAFISWISYIVQGTSIEEDKKWMSENAIIKSQYPGIEEIVKRGIDFYHRYYELNDMDYFLTTLYEFIESTEKRRCNYGLRGYDEFQYQLLMFFKNAYRDRRFFDAIQKKITIENPDVVKARIKQEYKNGSLSDRELDSRYTDYLKRELLSYFKDISVQYLGYDALERVKPNGEAIKIPGRYEDWDFDFLTTPRVISSSWPDVNERYYNYLLMDWAVHRLPRYYYNEQTGLYEPSDFGIRYQSETEQKLEQEIQSIKRLVPLKDRPKYFR